MAEAVSEWAWIALWLAIISLPFDLVLWIGLREHWRTRKERGKKPLQSEVGEA